MYKRQVHYHDSHRLRVFGFIRDEIKKGRQVYIVYPLIKESEKMDYKDLEDGYAGITQAFPPPEYVTVVVPVSYTHLQDILRPPKQPPISKPTPPWCRR